MNGAGGRSRRPSPVAPDGPARSAATSYLTAKQAEAVERNARHMKPKEYEWLKSQEFQPPIRVALIEAYERIHGATA